MLLSPFVSWLSLGWLAIEHDFGIFLDSRLSHVGCGIAGPKDVLPAANHPRKYWGNYRGGSASSRKDPQISCRGIHPFYPE
ncbi:hypothetical protein CPAR01_09597 [Colletotrichum paranaense]|uniref:Secreted protein n=2 Tax=Colletotrichum acutatum species complex TaxID=2707335 RepID=A0A9Q8WDF5_9PEZI|nr:uncharacterized protein CLUP02_04778 [Colletotrichum lupini]XP_060347992.1 uncharacterized protein CPAR01_09597 [Colletotrichum paranaense]KAK1536055.1 hypothetical protein CPAR01_09597 [Colletotrichum paranaense]KAK1702337.1 hypothetical protein BDP67DRAFT_538109 [Colletotrichum lupini]UQC79299.1 hypothetical protein CLUP02_04778 [Colletotrichum lupini]